MRVSQVMKCHNRSGCSLATIGLVHNFVFWNVFFRKAIDELSFVAVIARAVVTKDHVCLTNEIDLLSRTNSRCYGKTTIVTKHPVRKCGENLVLIRH